MKKQYSFKLAGIEFTPYRLVMSLFFCVAIIWGVNSYFYKRKAFENSSETIGKVVYLRNSKGVRVSLSPYITYEYQVKGMVYESGQKAEYDVSPKVGDCLKIKYSTTDPDVSEIVFGSGIVSCE